MLCYMYSNIQFHCMHKIKCTFFCNFGCIIILMQKNSLGLDLEVPITCIVSLALYKKQLAALQLAKMYTFDVVVRIFDYYALGYHSHHV